MLLVSDVFIQEEGSDGEGGQRLEHPVRDVGAAGVVP